MEENLNDSEMAAQMGFTSFGKPRNPRKHPKSPLSPHFENDAHFVPDQALHSISKKSFKGSHGSPHHPSTPEHSDVAAEATAANASVPLDIESIDMSGYDPRIPPEIVANLPNTLTTDKPFFHTQSDGAERLCFPGPFGNRYSDHPLPKLPGDDEIGFQYNGHSPAITKGQLRHLANGDYHTLEGDVVIFHPDMLRDPWSALRKT
ncbi:MAG: hypothetical protein Q9227_006908 [Pyrenula ochraceoflavens]